MPLYTPYVVFAFLLLAGLLLMVTVLRPSSDSPLVTTSLGFFSQRDRVAAVPPALTGGGRVNVVVVVLVIG